MKPLYFTRVKVVNSLHVDKTVQECDATMPHRSNTARLPKKNNTCSYAAAGMLTFFLLLVHFSFGQKAVNTFTKQVSASVFSLSKIMLHDVVNPPAASRYYAYCLFGAYDIVSQNDSSVPSINTVIKNYEKLAIPESNYNYQVAAIYSILETGRLLLPSGYLLQEDEDKFVKMLSAQKVNTEVIKRSVSVAVAAAKQVAAFAKTDHYNQLSAKLRYSPLKKEGSWYPTPPAYIEAVEPNWKTIRPLFLDSCNEFKPLVPAAFSKDSLSSFFRLNKEVYNVVNRLSKEQANIAAFWDCNPFAVSTAGHMSIGFKKISPGGHWMNISCIVAAKAHLNFNKTILLHTVLASAIMDAFISCWDEKYRSNRIRPETYINRYMDVKWQPLLQTPPFPEYPSGHSVISTASAVVLTYLLGDHFSFTDDSEVIFDLPKRSFTSFNQAANEAAISRLYGGIHFRDAVEQGQWQGAAVGSKVVSKIKSAGVGPLL